MNIIRDSGETQEASGQWWIIDYKVSGVCVCKHYVSWEREDAMERKRGKCDICNEERGECVNSFKGTLDTDRTD